MYCDVDEGWMAYWRSSTMGDVSDENERGDVALICAGDL